MLLSMTGYGAGQYSAEALSVSVEVRTVNNRYLKLHSRLPEGYAMLEPRLDEVIRSHIRRGAVQLNLDVRRSIQADDYHINTDLLHYYVSQLMDLQMPTLDSSISGAKLPVSSQVDLATLLALPGVIVDEKRTSSDAEADWPIIQSTLEEAMRELTSVRETEGATMAKDLDQQLEQIRRCAGEIEKLAPRVIEGYQARLTERLNKLLAEHDVQLQPADVVREVGVFAERVDISEEIVRLRSHLEQFAQIMTTKNGGGGRKLEFFVQELLRETNTIGSKANNAEIAKHVVEAKTCIERIREMVQNLE